MLKLKLQYLRPLNAKSQLIGKDSDAGKDWRQKEKGMAEDEMVGWHHQLNGREFEQILGDSGGQRSLVCYIHGAAKESTQLINWTRKLSQFSSVQFSSSVMSDSLWPHEPQHARPPCPSPTPRIYPNPCPSSWWCHPTIPSSVVSFSSCP